jgi:citronellol/citronellal dehydrogenase
LPDFFGLGSRVRVEGLVSLRGKTLFITGASRGIGKAIALRAARDGANVAVLGKTGTAHPKLEGTVAESVAEIERAGGRGLAIVCDVRNDDQVRAAVENTLSTFGGIDILVNNASAIQLTDTTQLEMKRFDLMHQVNVRATFMCSKFCIEALSKAPNPHILMLSPPLNIEARWFGPHLGYSLSKFGMSLCVLGLAEELKSRGIAVNALWPKTAIATAAVQNLLGGDTAIQRCRKPEIVADAAHAILSRESRTTSGNFFIDEEILRSEGVTDLEQYAVTPGVELMPDFFV